MSMCDRCIHSEVCEVAENYREAMTFCVDMKPKDVLDKIRAEVTALKSHHVNDGYDNGFQGCRIEVLDILDKYKTESEDKE